MIVFGQRRKITHLGLVADFCPICRGMQPHKIYQHNLVGHIYFLPLGGGKVLGYMASCQNCHLDFSVDPNKFQKVIENDQANILKLISETYPDYQKKESYRLALEAKLLSKMDLLPEERFTLVYEPFEAVIDDLELRVRGSTQFDKRSGPSCLLTMIIPLLFVCLAGVFPGTLFNNYLTLLIIPVGLIGTIITFYFLLTRHQRYLNKKIYPALANCLKPLNPTLEEISQTLRILDESGYKAARKFQADRILSVISNESTLS